MEFEIPKSQREGVAELIALLPEQRRALASLLANAKPALSLMELARGLAGNLRLRTADVRHMLLVIGSLAGLSEQAAMDHEEVVSAVVAAIKADHEFGLQLSTDNDVMQLRSDLKSVIQAGMVAAVTLKAVLLWYELPRRYCSENSRVTTDLRPVFVPDFAASPAAMTVLHNLKIGYHVEGGREREFFVTLDHDNLLHLRDQIDRAVEVEKVLTSSSPTTPFGVIHNQGNDE